MAETRTLVLRDGVTVGGKTVKTFTLREPTGSDLRGVMLTSLAQGSVVSFAKLLPRIATPHLTEDQVERLPLVDHLAILGALSGFFGGGPQPSQTPEDLGALEG